MSENGKRSGDWGRKWDTVVAFDENAKKTGKENGWMFWLFDVWENKKKKVENWNEKMDEIANDKSEYIPCRDE